MTVFGDRIFNEVIKLKLAQARNSLSDQWLRLCASTAVPREIRSHILCFTPKKKKSSVLSSSLWPHRLHSQWNSLGQNTGVGSHSLFQGIFPTQGSNPSLPHCRWILYQLSHQGSPRIVEWVGYYPFSCRSSRHRNRTRVSWIAGNSLPAELPGKPLMK